MCCKNVKNCACPIIRWPRCIFKVNPYLSSKWHHKIYGLQIFDNFARDKNVDEVSAREQGKKRSCFENLWWTISRLFLETAWLNFVPLKFVTNEKHWLGPKMNIRFWTMEKNIQGRLLIKESFTSACDTSKIVVFAVIKGFFFNYEMSLLSTSIHELYICIPAYFYFNFYVRKIWEAPIIRHLLKFFCPRASDQEMQQGRNWLHSVFLFLFMAIVYYHQTTFAPKYSLCRLRS